MMQTILPLAKIYSGGIGSYESQGKVKECYIRCNETGERLDFDDFIIKYNVSQINNSTDGGKEQFRFSPMAKYMRGKIKQHNPNRNRCFPVTWEIYPTNKFQGVYHGKRCLALMKDYSFQDYGVSGVPAFSMFMGFQVRHKFFRSIFSRNDRVAKMQIWNG